MIYRDMDVKFAERSRRTQSRVPMGPKACAQCRQITTPLFYDHKGEKLYCGRCFEIVGPRGPKAITKLGKSPPLSRSARDSQIMKEY